MMIRPVQLEISSFWRECLLSVFSFSVGKWICMKESDE